MDEFKAGPSCRKRRKHIPAKKSTNLPNILNDSGSEYDHSAESDGFDYASDSYDSVAEDVTDNIDVIYQIDYWPDEENLSPTSNWEDSPSGMQDIPFQKENKLLVEISGNWKPIDYFRLLLDDDFLNMVTEETNSHAVKVLCSQGASEKSRNTKWKILTNAELLTFIGLLLHTGTIKLNKLQDYWKQHPLFDIKCFSNNMSRYRFLTILRCLHFVKKPLDSDEISTDSLFKIRPLLNFFNKKMSDVYYPTKELYLDESMVLTRRSLLFRESMKDMPHKYGHQIYMLIEPNGLTLKLSVTSGMLNCIDSKANTTEVVLDLMQEKLNNGHSLYMDTYYSSCYLAEELLKQKTYCTGILRDDGKDTPKEVVNKKLAKNGTFCKYRDGVMVGKWRDHRNVLYISTEFTNGTTVYTDKRGQIKNKPIPLLKYNSYRVTSNRQDQIMAYYPCCRRTMRWYKKLGIHLIQLMLINSHLLHNKYSANKMTLYDFRLAVIEQLLHCDKTKTEPRGKVAEHMPSKITNVSKQGTTLRKRCKMCYKNKKRTDSIYHCEDCPDKPGLCLVDCFRSYHKPNK